MKIDSKTKLILSISIISIIYFILFSRVFFSFGWIKSKMALFLTNSILTDISSILMLLLTIIFFVYDETK
jgi:hypothetical protein